MIDILSGQIARTMRLLGVANLEELEPGHVTQLERLVPRPRAAGFGAGSTTELSSSPAGKTP